MVSLYTHSDCFLLNMEQKAGGYRFCFLLKGSKACGILRKRECGGAIRSIGWVDKKEMMICWHF